ncbi:MAG: hypothetical protein U9Q03_03970 [Patescibacteria group bacterium]|nr:hypothetical protein [Patescibacteria group bacterium]
MDGVDGILALFSFLLGGTALWSAKYFKRFLELRKARLYGETDEDGNLLVGEQTPKLTAGTPPTDRVGGRRHGAPPYRDGEVKEEGERDEFSELEPYERIRRFAMGLIELREQWSDDEIEAMADVLQLESLITTLVAWSKDGGNINPIITAFHHRTHDEDTSALVRLMDESDEPVVCIAALKCIEARGPETDAVISTVYRCINEIHEWKAVSVANVAQIADRPTQPPLNPAPEMPQITAQQDPDWPRRNHTDPLMPTFSSEQLKVYVEEPEVVIELSQKIVHEPGWDEVRREARRILDLWRVNCAADIKAFVLNRY